MSLQISLSTKENVLLIRLHGELDHHTADQLRQKVEMAINQHSIKHIVVNVADLSFMDSSGLGVLLGRYKYVSQQNGKMIICSISPTIYRLFEMSGMFKIIEMKDSERDAWEALGVTCNELSK